MTQTITAVYENGLLRPLTPLALPEHSRVELELRTVDAASAQARHERVRQALAAAGVLVPRDTTDAHAGLLTPAERATLAHRLAEAGVPPLSAAILEEREGRWWLISMWHSARRSLPRHARYLSATRSAPMMPFSSRLP